MAAGDLAYDALAQALARLPGEVIPSRAQAQAVGDRLAPLVRRAVIADLGKAKMSGWPDKGEADAFAVVLRTSNGTTRQGGVVGGGVMIIRDRRSAGIVRVLDRGRNMGQATRRGVVGGLAQGPGINTATGITARTSTGGVRKVRAAKGKRWNGYTTAEHTWTDALKLMRAAAPGAVNEVVAAKTAETIRKVVTGGR